MKKGIVFSFESFIALLFFVTILLSMNYETNNSLKELLILEQENDLLKIWSINFPSTSEMITDSKLLFNNFELFLDEIKIYGKKLGENGIGNETIIVDDNLIERKVRIIVYFD